MIKLFLPFFFFLFLLFFKNSNSERLKGDVIFVDEGVEVDWMKGFWFVTGFDHLLILIFVFGLGDGLDGLGGI